MSHGMFHHQKPQGYSQANCCGVRKQKYIPKRSEPEQQKAQRVERSGAHVLLNYRSCVERKRNSNKENQITNKRNRSLQTLFFLPKAHVKGEMEKTNDPQINKLQKQFNTESITKR